MDERVRLELLALSHAGALERFERDNRAFFAEHVGDRGDDYFAHFGERLAALVTENGQGTSLLCVLVDPAGEVLGRVNLTDLDQPELTELGFRVAQSAQGRGLATLGVRAALAVAAERGVPTVQARAAVVNRGSRGVLVNCGFVETGEIEAPEGSVETFLGFRKELRD